MVSTLWTLQVPARLKLLGITEKESLRSWTVMTTLMAFMSFATVAVQSLVV
jgi:H+/gluconate symporter-like permease